MRMSHGVGKPVLEQATIGQPGQSIVASQELGTQFAFLAFGEVDSETQERRFLAFQLQSGPACQHIASFAMNGNRGFLAGRFASSQDTLILYADKLGNFFRKQVKVVFSYGIPLRGVRHPRRFFIEQKISTFSVLEVDVDREGINNQAHKLLLFM